jgi:hypothetical protein
VLIDLIHKLDRGQPILEAPPERPAGAPPSGRALRPVRPHLDRLCTVWVCTVQSPAVGMPRVLLPDEARWSPCTARPADELLRGWCSPAVWAARAALPCRPIAPGE